MRYIISSFRVENIHRPLTNILYELHTTNLLKKKKVTYRPLQISLPPVPLKTFPFATAATPKAAPPSKSLRRRRRTTHTHARARACSHKKNTGASRWHQAAVIIGSDPGRRRGRRAPRRENTIRRGAGGCQRRIQPVRVRVSRRERER